MPSTAIRTLRSIVLTVLGVTLMGAATLDSGPSAASSTDSSPSAVTRQQSVAAEARKARPRVARPKARAKARKVCTGRGRARRCTTVAPVPAPAPDLEPVSVATDHAAPGGGDPAAYAFMFPNHGRPGRWNPCQAIHYRVNAHRAPAGATADLGEALARVTAATGLSFSYDGPTDELPQSGTGGHTGSTTIIAWANPGESNLLNPGAAGVGGASATTTPDGGVEIVRGFVVIDATQHSTPGFAGGASQGALLLHELGHMVGLHHVDDRAQIMYPTLGAGSPGDWGIGDRNGLAAVGAAGGCLG